MTSDMGIEIEKYDGSHKIPSIVRATTASFLHDQLGRFSDSVQHILAAMDYAMDVNPSKGGFVMIFKRVDEIIAAAVINRTGMSGYIPENILVYIAVATEERGKGLGNLLMQRILSEVEGDVALHVEPDNPARQLYEKIGFTNKYLEMRYSASPR